MIHEHLSNSDVILPNWWSILPHYASTVLITSTSTLSMSILKYISLISSKSLPMLNAIQETLISESECFLCHSMSVTSGFSCYSWKPHYWLNMFDWTHLRLNWPNSVCLALEGIIWDDVSSRLQLSASFAQKFSQSKYTGKRKTSHQNTANFQNRDLS